MFVAAPGGSLVCSKIQIAITKSTCSITRTRPQTLFEQFSRVATRRNVRSKPWLVTTRHYSSTLSKEPPQTIRSSGFAPLPFKELLAVSGKDAASFLQGLTTANVPTAAIADGERNSSEKQHAIYSAFLNPQGRILQDCFLYPLPPSSPLLQHTTIAADPADGNPVYIIEVDNSQSDALFKWLRRYKLRSKITLHRIDSGKLGVFFFWDQSSTASSPPDPIQTLLSKGAHCAEDIRSPGLGTRVLAPIEMKGFPVANSSKSDYTLRRYLHGLPEGPDELKSGTSLVHDSSLDKTGAVDFRKGCYVGQELVIRTQHTGVVRKRILPVILYPPDSELPPSLREGYLPNQLVPNAGTEIQPLNELDTPPEECGRKKSRKPHSAGKWIAGIGNVGIATVRLEPMLGIGPGGEKLEGWREPRFQVTEEIAGNPRNWAIRAFLPQRFLYN